MTFLIDANPHSKPEGCKSGLSRFVFLLIGSVALIVSAEPVFELSADGLGNTKDPAMNGKPHGTVAVLEGVVPAVEFDGKGFVLFGNPAVLQIDTALTIAVWIMNAPDETANVQYIVSKWSWNLYTDMRDNTNYPVFETRNADNDGWDSLRSSQKMGFNRWNHVVAVFDGERSEKTLYLNGQLVGRHETDERLGGVKEQPLYIGRYAKGRQQFRGRISGVRIFDRLLSAKEIQERYRREGGERQVDTKHEQPMNPPPQGKSQFKLQVPGIGRDFNIQEPYQIAEAGKQSRDGITLYQDDNARKEIAAFANRLEYTFEYELARGQESLSIQVPIVDGDQVRIHHGATRSSPDVLELDAATVRSEQRQINQFRYLEVDRQTSGFAIDTHPWGVYGEDPSVAEFSLRTCSIAFNKNGLAITYRIPRGYQGYPTSLFGKVVFYKTATSFAAVHPFDNVWEYGDVPKCYSLDFTAEPYELQRRTEDWATVVIQDDPVNISDQAYSEQGGFGWVDSTGIEVVKSDLNAVFYGSYATSRQAARFRMDCPNGFYYVTLNLASPLAAVGPFRIAINGTPAFEPLRLEAGSFTDVVRLVKVTDGHVGIQLEGVDGNAWLLSGLFLSPMGLLSEDYVLTAPWWHYENLTFIGTTPDRDYQPPPVTSAVIVNALMNTESATGEALETIMSRLFEQVPEIPFTQSTHDWLNKMQMSNWGASSSGNYRDYRNRDEAEARARELVRRGNDTAITHGLQNRLQFGYRRDELLAYQKMVTEVCHAHGLHVVDHLDITQFWASAYPFAFQHTDWLQQNIRTGTPQKYFCMNKPGYIDFLAAYLAASVEAGIDGFSLDEASFMNDNYCGCGTCRRKFHDETGYVLSVDVKPAILLNRDHPIHNLWVDWKKKCLAEAKARIIARLHEINPDVMLMYYNTALYKPNTSHDDMIEMARNMFIGTEGTKCVFQTHMHFFSQYKIIQGAAQVYGKVGWALYQPASADDHVFGGYFSGLMGMPSWLGGSQLKPLYNWKHWERIDYNRQVVADVGIVLAPGSRGGQLTRAGLNVESTHGWIQSLGEAGIQTQGLPDRLIELEHMMPYRVIVVPASANLSDDMCDDLLAYMKQGGNLILCGISGSHSFHGVPRDPKATLYSTLGIRSMSLAQAIEFRYGSIDMLYGGDDRTLTFRNPAIHGAGRTVSLPESIAYRVELENPDSAQVEAVIDDDLPALLSGQYGKGRWLLFSVLPGQINFIPRCYPGHVWSRYIKPQVRDLMAAVVRYAAGAPLRVDVRQQDRVLVTAVDKGANIQIHLLNVEGHFIEPGTKIPPTGKIPYPELHDIDVLVTGEAGLQAQLYIATQENPVTIQGQSTDDRTIFTVPAGTFREYAFLEIDRSPGE